MNKIGFKAVAALTLLATPALTFAAGEEVPMLVFNKFADIVSMLINYYLMFAGLIWIVFILIHGFGMLGKSDNRGKEEAKEKLMTTIKVGLWVLLLPAFASFALSLVSTYITSDATFNGEILNNSIKGLGNGN